MKAILEVKELVKKYGDFVAVKGISFDIQEGEIFSLLGPNGAGKTTTISVLSTLYAPTSGDATIGGYSITKEAMAIRNLIGVVPQELALYDDLSARENLVFWGQMYGLTGKILKARVEEVLEQIGLMDRARERVKAYSGGMKRRVNIGVGLLHKPRLLFMDEPTVGIDPQSRRAILDSVKDLNRQGMTVLYTTHYMEEAQELSDHIAIMDQGQIIAYGTHEELVRLVGEQTRIDLTLNVEAGPVLAAWQQVEGVSRVSIGARPERGGNGPEPDQSAGAAAPVITVLVDDSNRVLPRLFEAATREGARITSVDIREPNLEAVFLHLTGRTLRD
jgi:ABC-2 type transport system ATP-binding protein